MSYVTNAILSAHHESAEAINAEILRRDTRKQQFVSLDANWRSYGGTKVLERDLWVAAFNHFPTHAILEAIEVAVKPLTDWDSGWQLIACDEGEDFRVFGPGSYGDDAWVHEAESQAQ